MFVEQERIERAVINGIKLKNHANAPQLRLMILNNCQFGYFFMAFDLTSIKVAFDLTSIKEASHDFIHPELTNCIISVYVKIDATLGENLELRFMGELSSTAYVYSDRKKR